MTYRRYGKFEFKDNLSIFYLAATFLGFGIAGILIEYSMIYSFILIVVGILDAISVVTPYREMFEVNQNILIVRKRKKIKKIILPTNLVVVISYADMCTDLAKRVTLYNNTYMLKGKWSISLLENVAVEKVIERLHGNGAWRYTNCWVEYLLKQNFIYNFVCNQSILEEVLCDKNYTLIIPETLLHMIDTKKLKGDIYIDKGF